MNLFLDLLLRANIQSKLLKLWKRNLDDTEFYLCPITPSIKFKDGTSFDSYYLSSFLRKIIPKIYSNKYQVKLISDCLFIEFEKSFSNFFKKLSYYENAPSLPINKKGFSLGLGQYDIVEKTSLSLKLKRKKKVRNGYNKINFLKYYSGLTSKLNTKIEDYNRVLINNLPRKIKNQYKKYDVTLLQSVNLVLNIKNPKLRFLIFNCLPIKKFTRSFAFGQKKFKWIKTILPIGMPYSKEGLVKQKCLKEDFQGLQSQKLVFLNWRQDNVEAITAFFKSFSLEFGIKVHIQNASLSSFVDQVLKKPHNYQMTVVALDTVRPDFSAFFSYIAGSSESLIDQHHFSVSRFTLRPR